jgi:hypothetical protein
MYTEQERRIFAYHNGRQQVHGDPLRIERVLTAILDGNVNRALQQARDAGDPKRTFEAMDRLLGAVRNAFDLHRLDPATGQGATETDCCRILSEFVEWMEKKDWRAESLPTSVPSTGSADSADASTSTLTASFT